MFGSNSGSTKIGRSPSFHHIECVIWKAYLQRQRRWRILIVEILIAAIMFLFAIYYAKPVFLTPLQDEPVPQYRASTIMDTFDKTNIVGFAPYTVPYIAIMDKVANYLHTEMDGAYSMQALNTLLHEVYKGQRLNNNVIWIIFSEKKENVWRYTIRSTESESLPSDARMPFRDGFVAVQIAVSLAICEHEKGSGINLDLSLTSMPVSPLMEEDRVRHVTSLILLFFTVALLPPVMETQALVVSETGQGVKRALRMRGVTYTSMYMGYFFFCFITALPVYVLGSITLIMIFRWIHLTYALLTLVAYGSVMMMLALIMGMFHEKAKIACIWSTSSTLVQTLLAQLMVHNNYDDKHSMLTFILHMLVPPLGLVHGFNQFALLQTRRTDDKVSSPLYTIMSWLAMNLVYFMVLMMLQRTIGQARAIGGQVSWKSIIFKQGENSDRLRRIRNLTGKERDALQEVDEFVAKAVSFRGVTKHIMGEKILNNVTFDIYRGEYTILYAQRVSQRIINTLEDLLTGLTDPDTGTINVLGVTLTRGKMCMTDYYMLGYCNRAAFLIDDMTVEEHIMLWADLCLWSESSEQAYEYTQMRMRRLLQEHELAAVREERVSNLDMYYRAQLCWAIAVIMEPRIVMIPSFGDNPLYMAVIKDKIQRYKKYLSIVRLSFTSINLEYADRVFLFDNTALHFGGSPGYLFFVYGREYRVRISFRKMSFDDHHTDEILEKAEAAGATVRAHFGSLLILRVPTSPSEAVAKLAKDLTDEADKYGISSINIALPDSEEVCSRAMFKARSITSSQDIHNENESSDDALKMILRMKTWKRVNCCKSRCMYLRALGWKFFSFYVHYRIFLVMSIIEAVVAAVFMGLAFAQLVLILDREHDIRSIVYGSVLSVESLERTTTLIVRIDNSSEAKSVASAYAMSETGATHKQVARMGYTVLQRPNRMSDYLATRAIDSPQEYVYMYAYGLDVALRENETYRVHAFYSPMHKDYASAERSLSRVFTALVRHFSGHLDASIEVTDNPLVLGVTPGLDKASDRPFLVQLLLILTISHITLIPSKEHGLIRHMQSHAYMFSPAMYWFTLYFCDLVLYWLLVGMMTVVMVGVIFMVAPYKYIRVEDFVIVPFLLIVYGIGCMPQGYIISLGSNTALNTLVFIMFNIVFGETTILENFLTGSLYDYATTAMLLLPQYNVGRAFMKISKIFVNNTECYVFTKKNLCVTKPQHKCCDKCGVLTQCYKKEYYLTMTNGIVKELTTSVLTAAICMSLLLLWEYKGLQRAINYIRSKILAKVPPMEKEMAGARTMRTTVESRVKEIHMRKTRDYQPSRFGQNLIACNISCKDSGAYRVRNVHLGIGPGEILAISGLKRHGRTKLCKLLSGFTLPDEGALWTMGKWQLSTKPHNYGRHIALSCDMETVPPWMTVYDSLELLAILRGMPYERLNVEITRYIQAMELEDRADILVCRLMPSEKKRLNFLAAVVAAPPVLVLDECTAYQTNTVRRAMYCILHHLRRRGHSIFLSSNHVETHLPATNRLAIMRDGKLFDVDSIERLLARHSNKGYTVAVHLKDETDVPEMFRQYFTEFTINDTADVLVNVQILDKLDWGQVFTKMEQLKQENHMVYSYIVTCIPIDYIYNNILSCEQGLKAVPKVISLYKLKTILFSRKPKRIVTRPQIERLMKFQPNYSITKLKNLPWTVIFQK